LSNENNSNSESSGSNSNEEQHKVVDQIRKNEEAKETGM
jgi:hypothetical protein